LFKQKQTVFTTVCNALSSVISINGCGNASWAEAIFSLAIRWNSQRQELKLFAFEGSRPHKAIQIVVI
jgi:hypothetical protein